MTRDHGWSWWRSSAVLLNEAEKESGYELTIVELRLASDGSGTGS
jgi:hypothetical protein